MNLPDPKPELESSFVVSGSLKVSPAELSKRLLTVPALREVKNDKTVFRIAEPTGKSNSELKIAANKLTYRYRFERKSAKVYATNLVTFLSVLASISDIYEPELASLYPILIEVVASYVEILYGTGKIENTELLVKKIKCLSEMNCSLSLSLLDFQSQNQKLVSDKALLASFSRDVLYNAMERIGTKATYSDFLPKALGTTTEKCTAVHKMVSEVIV